LRPGHHVPALLSQNFDPPNLYFTLHWWLKTDPVSCGDTAAGLYVSRNTYIRAGIAEWRTTNPVHLVHGFSSSSHHFGSTMA
jgi:hypothetical protein